MTSMAKSLYVAGNGEKKEIVLSLEDYSKAAAKQMTLRQYMNEKHPDASEAHGSAFAQMAANLGYNLNPKATGKKSIAEVLNGTAMAGSVVAPNGSDNSIGARLIMPELILAVQEQNLQRDTGSLRDAMASKVAMRTQVTQPAYWRPYVDSDTNKNFEAQEIAQGALPDVLVKIKTSQTPYTVTPRSFGLEITDQAMQYSTLDQVAMMIGSARRSIDNANVYKWISRFVSGDPAYGMTALTPVNASTYDTNATGGILTQKAWIKMLTEDIEYWTPDTIIGSIDDVLEIEGRANRPTTSDDTGKDNRINNQLNLMNLNVDTIDTIVVADDSVLGAATNFLMFDSAMGLEYVTNVSATYEAVQDFVLRRSSQMRFDVAEEMYRFKDDVFKLVTRQ